MNVNRSTPPDGSSARLGLVEPPAESAPAVTEPVPVGRIVGIDLARALAVFGMFFAHVAPRGGSEGFAAWLMELPHGRSSALFATLAGVSLVLLAGGKRPKRGREGRRVAVRIALRAVILFVLGSLLTALDTSVAVILAYYGLYFLLALPFMRLRSRTLVVLAAACAIFGSTLRLWLQAGHLAWAEPWFERDPLVSWGVDGVVQLFLVGFYPAVAWMAYVFAGMAIGRLDLAAGANRVRLAIIGPALALIGYCGSWPASKLIDAGAGVWGGRPAALLGASPHSGTPFELVGNIGVAVTVIIASVVLLDRFGHPRRLLAPVTAVGTMSLTVYVGHILVLWFMFDRTELPYETGWALWGYYVAGAVVFAFAWSRFFRRGPLEYGIAAATRIARLVK
ncbi:heparan-alpha-glucosaminide N-acetyltransferase domain-containing protein [Glycomyces albus]